MKRALCVALLLLAPAALAQSDRATEELRAEMVFWESIRSGNNPADFRAYLEQYPQGRFAALARNRLVAPGTKPAAQGPGPQPPPAATGPGALSAGDTWTYRLLDGKTRAPRAQHQVRLLSTEGGSLVEELASTIGAPARFEHRKGNYLYSAGDVTLFSPYAMAFGGPAFGSVENLDERLCAAGWTCRTSGRVAGRDRVQVPAGTFEATRIEVQQDWSSPSHPYARGEMVSRTITVWYAPEVKRAVKVMGRGAPSSFVDTNFDLELVSYKLQ